MEQKKTQACMGEFFLFFVCDLLSAETRVLSSRKTLIRKTHNHTLLNMTARITYKRRYVLDALLAFFFLFCVYSLGEETVGCDASAFRNVPRSRV